MEIPEPGIDREIYAMPAFVSLAVSDFAAAKRWYTDGLGFVVLAELGGGLALVHLRRFRYQDILLRPGGTRAGCAGLRAYFAAGDEDLEARAAALQAIGGGTVDGPRQTPWNTRELVARDRDGYEVVLTQHSPRGSAEEQARFAEMLRDSVVEPRLIAAGKAAVARGTR